jgi:hypothetical protein
MVLIFSAYAEATRRAEAKVSLRSRGLVSFDDSFILLETRAGLKDLVIDSMKQ